MRMIHLTQLAFGLNAAIDTGKYGAVTREQVQEEIRRGTIFTFIASQMGEDVDLSLLDTETRQELSEEWSALVEVASSSRKFGVERGGVTLLLAYVIEGIQRRTKS